MSTTFDVFIFVRKPVQDVFAAVYDPDQLRQYFTTGGASAPMRAGATVTWEFADFPGPFQVNVLESEANQRITFNWPSREPERTGHVDIRFEAQGANATKVTIREGGWNDTAEGRQQSYGNCMGWAQMLCCLKAWLEYGINLREGAYRVSGDR
ncbi:MAG: SRPBCC domain-containing protein [Acidobacteriaceae bacterium]|jgi:uncharacterized protein YndB with AHSA1/START domain|nr:SRPBCC domain-containing protein [Acidobacteriaceae bacterium]